MKNFTKKYLYTFLILLTVPTFVFAHQPRIVNSRITFVDNPEISKAYYATLQGVPDVYTITSTSSFSFYLNTLVPDLKDQKKDIVAVVMKDGKQIAILDGSKFEWQKFFEFYGHDTYWSGPKYKAELGAGNYMIFISSSKNDSKYSLAIGEKENFDLKESWNAIKLIPKIKKSFFVESPISFMLTPFGFLYVIILYVLAMVFGVLFKTLAKKFGKDENKNMNKYDRLSRFVIGIILIVFALMTTWNPFIIFISGLAFFASFSGWCGLYLITGNNTCKM